MAPQAGSDAACRAMPAAVNQISRAMFDEPKISSPSDKVDEDDAPIQYQFEQNGDVNRSVIEADMDGDDILPVRITLAESERNRQHAPLAGHGGRVLRPDRRPGGPVLSDEAAGRSDDAPFRED
jgi:hypothetical protein